jgi:hypothetical protein
MNMGATQQLANMLALLPVTPLASSVRQGRVYLLFRRRRSVTIHFQHHALQS